MPGMRPTLESSKNVRIRMSVSGTRYVNTSFGRPGIKNRMNTMMFSLPVFSNLRNFSRYCTGTMLCTNGAPSLCTSAKMNALEMTHPARMTSAPIQGPYSRPAAICTTSPGMNATTICRN